MAMGWETLSKHSKVLEKGSGFANGGRGGERVRREMKERGREKRQKEERERGEGFVKAILVLSRFLFVLYWHC